MNRSKHCKVCECCGKPVRPGDIAFERRSTAESDVHQRAKAVSTLRFATALQDASRATEIFQVHGFDARFGNR
jgi:hypothetical protein